MSTPIVPPWRLAANHWLSRTLQILLAVAILLGIWASATGRGSASKPILGAIGVIFLVWAIHYAWQLHRQRAQPVRHD